MKHIIESFKTQGGDHCVTNALKQIFLFYGISISEPMLFGIAEGLDFTYINLAASPLVSGRSKIMEFEDTLARRLQVCIKMKKPADYTKALAVTKKMIDNGQPVYAYVDMPYLPYLGMDQNSHFGGHAIVIFGYDDDRQCFYVSERDNSDFAMESPVGLLQEDYHLVSYEAMEKARNSAHRPFPANNKYASIDLSGYKGISADVLATSIHNTCQTMLSPGANLKGINGILKFSAEVKKAWPTFDDERLFTAGITNYFQISASGGTGGGIFRKLYGKFLQEAASIINSDEVGSLGRDFIHLAEQWDEVAAEMHRLSQTGSTDRLSYISQLIERIYEREKSLLGMLSRA